MHRTNESRRTTLARHRTVFLLSHVQIVAARQTFLATSRGHLLFDRLQQRRTSDDNYDDDDIAKARIGNGRRRRRRSNGADDARANAAAATGRHRARFAGRRRETDRNDQRIRVGFPCILNKILSSSSAMYR